MPRGRRKTFFTRESEERQLVAYLLDHSIGEAAVFFDCHRRTIDAAIHRIRIKEAQSAQTDGPSSQRPVSGTTERTSEDTSSAKPGDSATQNPTTHGNH